MPAMSYQYNRPSETFTIDQFIACQSDTDMSYFNLSFVDKIRYAFMNETIYYSTYNALSNYIDEIRERCINVVLTDNELNDYIYRPKLLAHRIYGNGELAFIILIANDMYSVKQFTRANLLLPTKASMIEICKQLFSANKQAITKYNNQTIYEN